MNYESIEAAPSVATAVSAPAGDGLGVAQAMQDLTAIALVRGDLRGMLTRLCQASVELLDASAAGVVLLDTLPGSSSTSGADETPFEAEARLPGTVPVRGETSRAGVQLQPLTFPMCANGEIVGHLVVFRCTADPMADAEAAIARMLVSVAAGLVWRIRAHERDRALVGQLQHALVSRVVIEQAKGILSAQLGVTVDQAFEVLRTSSRQQGAHIHRVAATVVEGNSPFETP
jgi:ANTAR domain